MGKNESWGKKKMGGGVNVLKEISLATTQFVDVTANMALEVMHMTSILEVAGLNLAIFKFLK